MTFPFVSLQGRSFWNVQLSRPLSFGLLYGIGMTLAGSLLFFTGQSLQVLGRPLGPVLIQTVPPLLMAVLLPLVGWWMATATRDHSLSSAAVLSEEAKGATLGGLGFLLIAGAVLGLRLEGEGLPSGLLLSQMASAGAIAGLFGGFSIASLKDTHAQLRERESRLRGLTHSVPGLVYQFEVHPDGTYQFTFVSDHAETLLGISAAPDGFFDRFVQQVPTSHREDLLASIEEAVANEETWAHEMPFDRPSGERIWVKGRSTPERRGDRVVYHGVTLDVTERKEKQRDARRRAEAMEVASDGMALLGPNGTFTYVNRAFADIHGYEDRDAFLGNSWRMCYGGDELTRLATDVMPTLREDGAWQGEAVGRRKDGRPFPQQVAFTTWREEEIICVVRDRTDEKEQQRQFEAIFNNTYQFTGLMDPDGTLLQANDTALDFGGVSREEVVGKPVWETYWFQGDAETKQTVEEAVAEAASGQFVRRELTVRGADQEALIDFSIRPITDDDGMVTKLIPEGRDITEIKEKEQALIEAKEEAERMNELKSAFLANMSHEIRTPLTSILGFADMIEEEAQALDGEGASLAQFAGRIGKSGRRLLNTLETVLSLSKLESGEADLSFGRVDLVDEAADLVQRFEPEAESARVSLQADCPDHPMWARADREAVRIVLRNLMDNALKFTKAGGGARVCVQETEGRPTVVVEDTGIGMEPERVPQLFDAFEQASTGMDRSHEGSGLGLTLARDLTERMGGSLAVDTAKGEGTEVAVFLPPSEAGAAGTEGVRAENGRGRQAETSRQTRIRSESPSAA